MSRPVLRPKKSRVSKTSERFEKVRKPKNLTSRRLTILPGFLSCGVESETVQKPSPQSYHAGVLTENLHGLVSSSRSKSIFREIKEKYETLNSDFSCRIFAKLGPNFTLKDTNAYKQEVLGEVQAINDILAGKSDPDMSMNRKRPFSDEDKENFPFIRSYIPPTKWVFQTPPNRKLNYSHVKIVDDTCGMKPAILENRNEQKIVYEMNNKINVDFSRFSNGEEIDIDKRYMVEVGNAADFTFQIPEETDEKKFQLQTDPYELENHFLSLTCRPKKAPRTVSRLATLKKRDFPEAQCSSDEFDSSFTFINNNLSSLEESFTFKFTSNNGATTGHIFDFEGNQKDSFNFHY